MEFKIGIEKEEFDASYDDFMKTCPKVRKVYKSGHQCGKMENISLKEFPWVFIILAATW